MEYSAVIQPPVTFCSFIQRGTFSSTVTAQMTWVRPQLARTDPAAWGAMPGWKVMGRSWPGLRPSWRGFFGGGMGKGWVKGYTGLVGSLGKKKKPSSPACRRIKSASVYFDAKQHQERA